MYAANMKNSCVAFLNAGGITGIAAVVSYRASLELLYLPVVRPLHGNNTEQYWNFNAERNVSVQTH